jgi:hypothetical protein
MLKIVYAFFLGILLAIFVGVGIAAFYSEPTPPKAPDYSSYGKDGPTAAQQAEENAYNKKWDDFNKNKMNPYHRNVSIIALVAAVIFVVIGLLFERRINALADGALLGGVFTLLYSLGRSFASESSKYSFIVVSVGLVTVLSLGYLRFIRSAGKKKA